MRNFNQAWGKLGSRLLLGAALWLAFPAISIAACNKAPLDDNSLTLLEVSLGGGSGIVLEDIITAYQAGDGLYLPLGALTRALDFPIEVNATAVRAEGWFLDPDRTFVLDIAECRASVEERDSRPDPARIAPRGGDIYVHELLLEQWFPLELDFDPSELRLAVTALEPLPLQQHLEREQRWERHGVTRGAEDGADGPVHDIPYRFMDWPFIDATVETQVREPETGEKISTSRYKVIAAGDFLKMNAQVSVAGTDGDALDSFVTLSRRDPRRNLLGLLNASEFAVGDIGIPQDPLIANNSLGRGFHVSNLPLDRPREFDRFSLRGELPLGWDVELYRNGQLVAFQSAQTGDRYDFTDIPLDFGVNHFRLVFYGPQGQIREETLQRVIGQDMIRPGEHYYQFTAMRERDLFEGELPGETEDPRFSFGYDYGIARALSIGATARRLVLDEVEQDYLTAHTNLSLPGAFGRIEYASQVGGGRALSALLSTRVLGLDVSAESSRFEDFDSERLRLEIVPGDLLERNELRLRGRVARLGFGARIQQNRGTEGERFEAESQLSLATRYGTATHIYEEDLTRTAAGEIRLARQRLLFSTHRGAMSLRGEVVQELLPDPYIRSVGLTADWALGDRATLRVGANRSPLEDITTYSAGVSWLFDRFALGMNMTRSDNGEMTAALVLSGSFTREPVSRDWNVTSSSRTPFGALAVHVFLDNNGNGAWDASEPPVPDAALLVGHAARDRNTDDNGYVYIPGLPPYEITDVSVDPASLVNPFWQVENSKTSIVPRPGRTASIRIPVTPTGSIEGAVLKPGNGDSRPAPGERVYLLTSEGERIDSTVSAYDGYYYFDGIPPGFYRIRLGRAGLDRAYDPDDMLIEIHGGMSTIGFVDLLVRDASRHQVRRPPQTPPREAPLVEYAASGYTIQLMAASTERTVRRYIARHGLGGETAYLRTSRNGAPWYQVLFGRYPDAMTARAAIQQLPSALKSAGPYIRPLRSLTGEMTGGLEAPEVIRSEAWVLSRPGGHYTVQLLAVRREAEARAFIERHGLADSAAYFRTRRNGRDWYSVAYGEFRNRAEAGRAAASLPRELRVTQPWIRSFGSIQDAIRTR